MAKKKKVSQSEILRRKKQSNIDYQIYNHDKIFKDAERKRKQDLIRQYNEFNMMDEE